MAELSKSPQWIALAAHAKALAVTGIPDLIDQDPDRLSWSLATGAGITLDIGKNQLSRETLGLLVDLADSRDLKGWQNRMIAGQPINSSEGRAVLHMALRDGLHSPPEIGGAEIGRTVSEARSRFLAYADDVRKGVVSSSSGKPFDTVVNIGIGGSDLGPRLAADALRPFWTGNISPHFVANVDAAEIDGVLQNANPETTLFVVASKTFTTQETMCNAATARDWLRARLPKDAAVGKHFVAVSSNTEAAREFGIEDRSIFGVWDWVGGRFSVWSSVGLSLALALGREHFEGFLAGAAEMDRHFLSAPFDRNLPVLLALVGIWNHNFLKLESHAILPYDHGLSLLPAYLQQLEMESNGKSVRHDGAPVDTATGPLTWGGAGTNAQHAFYQWLHQGTGRASADIILPLQAQHSHPHHHDILVAHAIAQSEALALGRDRAATRKSLIAEGLSDTELERLLPHRIFAGSRPNSVITVTELSPKVLGALLALYEHKVFTQGVLWDINSFDQWGVELGKTLAGKVLIALNGQGSLEEFDPSTRNLIETARKARSSDRSET